MRIASTGLDLPEGKIKYMDPIVQALADKFSPKKVSWYYCKFLRDDYEAADVIAIERKRILDLLILDIDKLETRRERSSDSAEQELLDRVIAELEEEVPVCAQAFSEADLELLGGIGPLSLKPTLVFDGETVDVGDLIARAMSEAGQMFFYTSGKPEVHAWLVQSGDDAVTCAGKIHSDLARGFVKAELVTVDDLLECHSLQDARSRGLTQVVDRDFIIPERTVLDIRFNV
jgi:ribosome-binding ATPase YchF (GTP1/OBG family)